MRAALARRGRSGGSSDPAAPAAAAGAVTWVAEERGRSQWDLAEGILARGGCVARRSLGMVEAAAAESMAVVARLLAPCPAEEIGFGSSTGEEERRRRRVGHLPGPAQAMQEGPRAQPGPSVWAFSGHLLLSFFSARCLGQPTLFLIRAQISWANYHAANDLGGNWVEQFGFCFSPCLVWWQMIKLLL